MDQLDFELNIPDAIASKGELKGGRYCSVDGRIAAQLRYEAGNSKATCYISSRIPRIKAEKHFNLDEVEVIMWSDEERTYVWADGMP